MKPQPLLLLTLFVLFFHSAIGQVKFKVKLLPDNVTYQVLLLPETTWNLPFNAVPSAQITFVVPTGGFQVGTVTSLAGTWSNNATIQAPAENPGFDYIVFGLQGATSAISFQEGVEVPVFQFTNAGSCTGALELIENNTDPFWPPNSQSVNVGNQISVVGAGIGVNAYTGNYGAFSADCTPISNCGIEVFDVATVSPSECGVADGSIQIVATNSNGFAMQYSINGGSSFQASPVFNNLAAGDIFEIIVRDIIPICIVEVGDFELDGPLAAAITGIDLVDPDCGDSNGSITINAFSENGGTLEYGINDPPTWQISNTFTGLVAGDYALWVRDIDNNCENAIGDYTLNDCPPQQCIAAYQLEYLGNGQYQVNLLPDTTYSAPDNITASAQITIKVPTGGFEVTNLTMQTPNVSFAVDTIYMAPPEEPGFDYINFDLTSLNTQDIPYVAGDTIHLFTFENGGACTGDSIYLMKSDDPFFPVDSADAIVGQQLSVSGSGAGEAPVCIDGTGVVECGIVAPPPPPPGPSCLVSYELEELPGNIFQISMTVDTTWTFPNNITSSAQWTVKVPTGGFVASNLTSLLPGVNFSVASTYTAPTEDPAHDYISFILASPGTQGIPYQQGVKTPLFTFGNSGACQGGSVFLMDNDTDPFFPPNSQSANVGQQLTVSGYGGADAPICAVNNQADDCDNDPCASLSPGFTASDACEGEAIDFTNTTTSIGTVTSWNWDFGDGSAPSNLQSPSHTYSISGNFEVSLTVTTEDGCDSTFSDFVTVFSKPGGAATDFYSMCSGDSVQLQSPAGLTAGWSPSTGLSDANVPDPFAFPAATTVYTLTLTNTDGCTNSDQITVQVNATPTITEVNVSNQSDCGVADGEIEVVATGTGSLQYSLNNGPWQSSKFFTGLTAGDYNIQVRNATGAACPKTFDFNPVTIDAPPSPSITNVTPAQPSNCQSNGGIVINASGGAGPLRYSINGGQTFQSSHIFQNLGGGTYQPAVANSDESCVVLGNPVVLNSQQPPSVLTPVADFSLCQGASGSVSIQISENIQNYNITGTGAFSNPALNGSTLTFDVAPSGGTVNYSITFTGATSGCTTSEAFQLTELLLPTAAFTNSTPLCTEGLVTLNFTGSAGPSPSLTWSLDGGTINFNGTNAIVASWDSPGDKNVCLTVNDAGCTDTVCEIISISDFDPGASIASADLTTCGSNDGTINLTLSGNGNYTFSWSGPGVQGATQQNLSNLASGFYQVTIIETNSGCSSTASTTVDEPEPVSIINLTAGSATDCSGATDGSISVQVTGGSTPYIFNLYDAGNPGVPVASQSGSQNSATFTGLPPGAYMVEVTTAEGCSDSDSEVVMSSGGTLNATIADQQYANCGDADGAFTLSVQGGQAPYTYDLYQDNNLIAEDQPFNSQSLTIGSLTPATYVVIVTDNFGCLVPVVVEVESATPGFIVNADITNPTCNSSDGSIELSGFPLGAIFSWTGTNGSSLPPTDSQANLPVGIYAVTVTDGNGCSNSYSYALEPSDGPIITISSVADASCGNANGEMTFQVTNCSSFNYKVLNSSITGFGSVSDDITVSGLTTGAYVLEVTDLTTACVAYIAFVVDGSNADLQVLAITTPPTGCGVQDASICLDLSGGASPYTIQSSQGISPADPVDNNACVQGLYEGEVEITVMDANGCSVILSIELPEIDEPTITTDDVTVTGNTCPDAFDGSIVSNTGIQYSIFDENNVFKGVTPMTQVPAGNYKVVYSSGICSAEITVTVTAPPAWELNSSALPETCDGNDGSITLTVTGANGGYTLAWDNGDTGFTADSLSSTGSYSVVVTDSEGCTAELTNLSVPLDCIPPDCDDIFFVDTFHVALVAGLTEICLPTHLPDISTFDLSLDGFPYEEAIGDCTDSTIFYGYGMLLNLGNPPFHLGEWTYGELQTTDFTFNNIGELVTYMNLLDPTGNWVVDTTDSSISGGANSFYGSLIITHLASNTTLTLQVNTLAVAHPSIFVDDSPIHVFIATDGSTGCADTLYINLLDLTEPQTDTISVQLPLGSSQVVCVTADDLNGVPGPLESPCLSFTNNTQLELIGDLCAEVTGMELGADELCLVLCDGLGNCDTTILLIEVVDTSTALVIYNGFSPNEDGINDFFKIKNIELYPDNSLTIYNRWGNRVYQTERYSNENPWKAIYRNTNLPDGTYFYILDVKVNSEKKRFSGYVEVRR